jgi:hypothetical protein
VLPREIIRDVQWELSKPEISEQLAGRTSWHSNLKEFMRDKRTISTLPRADPAEKRLYAARGVHTARHIVLSVAGSPKSTEMVRGRRYGPTASPGPGLFVKRSARNHTGQDFDRDLLSQRRSTIHHRLLGLSQWKPRGPTISAQVCAGSSRSTSKISGCIKKLQFRY